MAKKKDNPFLKKATETPGVSVRSEKRHGLGRGLDSLLSAPTAKRAASVPPQPAAAFAPAPVREGSLEVVIADIDRCPFQPRREFKAEELNELAESLKNNGLVQPPTIRRNAAGRYELIAGERRIRAAQQLGWKKIRVTLVEADDLTAATMNAAENLQREDLNPIEEATSYRALQDRFGLSQADVAEKVGKGRATVANAVRLLELPDEVKALVQARLLSVGHAKVILGVESEKDRVLLSRDCVNNQLSVRALENKIKRLKDPVPVKNSATDDLPDVYVKALADKLKKHLGCAVRVTSGKTHKDGRHTKGVLEIDFFDNDDLDRIIRMIGVEID